jgi:glutathione synthase/RimK-type ligase-like ATP-grasp enzyme
MKTIYIRGGKDTNTAVRMLTNHLEGLGHGVARHRDAPHDVIVCWGMSVNHEVPTLNGNVNKFDKFQAICEFHDKEIPAPNVFTTDKWNIFGSPESPFPWLARNWTHKGGKDIIVVNNIDEANDIDDLGHKDFFSVYTPTKTEYRVWVFKDKAFAVYEKQWKGEGEYQGIQRNRHFGFKFVKQDEMLEDNKLCSFSIDAVAALEMDFGAVDVVLGKDDKYYVLEVNSMPNISSLKKSSGIRLAKRISQWAGAEAQ